MCNAAQVVSITESPEQNACRAEKQFCFLRLFAFPADDVAHRAVIQTLCVDTRSYRYRGDTTRLGY